MANNWDYFDKVYCISLDTRKDRQKEANSQFEKVGLSGKVEFIIVKKHPLNSEQGIYESHISCIKKGIMAGAKNILIFEDDIIFDGFAPCLLQNCTDFLSTEKNWNILFFGCLVKGIEKKSYPSILKIQYRCSAHAYLLNRNFAENIVKKEWNNIAFDDMLASYHQDGFYTVYPSFAFQSSSSTDNDRCLNLDKIRRLCGGLKLIQKMNEFYNYHKPLIIAVHIFVILIIIGIIWI